MDSTPCRSGSFFLGWPRGLPPAEGQPLILGQRVPATQKQQAAGTYGDDGQEQAGGQVATRGVINDADGNWGRAG